MLKLWHDKVKNKLISEKIWPLKKQSKKKVRKKSQKKI